MNPIEECTAVIDAFKKLDSIQKNMVLMDLMEKQIINFIDLSKMYVDYLEKKDQSQWKSLSTVGLLLAFYCANDKSPTGQNARKHLYDSGAFGHNDGSIFGQKLDEEFKNEK